MARSTKISTFKVETKDELIKKLEKTRKIAGPVLILVKISKSKKTSKRVNI